MAIKINHKGKEIHADTIMWDRDSYFTDFNSYWSRVVASIAQKVAESTTNNWNNFNVVRTRTIKLLGINPDTSCQEPSSPVTILPVSVFPILLASNLKDLLPEKKLNEISDLFQVLVEKTFHECKAFIKSSILQNNIEIIKNINSTAKHILVTNDLKENCDIFIKDAGIENQLTQCLTDTNKLQLSSYLKEEVTFITSNHYLESYYIKKNIKNILLVENISSLTFSESVNNNKITINIDGASKGNPGPAGIGITFYRNDESIEQISEYIGEHTNNYAEYTALIRALETSLTRGFQNIEVKSDSELVVKQINKEYKVKDADIKDLYDKARSLIEQFSSFKIKHVVREENLRADKLANEALKKIKA